MKPGKSIVELAQELERQNATKRDYLAPSNHILVRTDPETHATTLDLDGCGAFGARDTAHEQLAGHVGIPLAYYRRMRQEAPRLFDYSVNHWLSQDTSLHMVRTLDGQARAVLSDRYRPLDNFELADAALPVLLERGFEVVSSEITERRFYLKAVSPRIQGEVKKGDVVQAGITISNSEIGDGSLSIFPLVYFLACLNGAVMEDARFRRNHVGRHAGDVDAAAQFYRDETREADDRAFWLKVRDTLGGALSQVHLDRQIDRLRAAAGQPVAADPVRVVEVTAKRFRLADDEKNSVLRHFLAGHNGQSELTQYGLAQAITRASQDLASYDRASEFEHLGGQVIELPPAQWRALAEARA